MAILAFLEDVFQKIKLAARGLTPKSTDNVPKNPNPIVDKEDEDVQDSETEKTLSGLAAEGEPEPEEEVEKEEVEEEEILSSSIQPPKTISHGQEGEVTSGFDTTTPPPPALEEDERRPIEIALEPVLIPPVLVSGTSVTHDESDGVQGSPAEDTTATLPLPFSTILGSLSELGHAWSLGKVIINAPAGIQNIALTNTATDSGLDTLDNKDILLSIDLTDDNIIWGKEAGTGDEVFALYLDETDNSLWLSQFQPIKHTPDTGPDQVATIADKIHVTVTDNNATTATAPLIINIVDDGIDLQLTPPTYDITHDESPGEQTGTSDDTNVANPPSWLGNLGTVAGAAWTFLDLGSEFNVEGGAADAGNSYAPTDEFASIVVTLNQGVANGADSGLTTGGTSIYLYNETIIDGSDEYHVVVGREGGSGGDAVFVLAVTLYNPPSNNLNDLWFVQYQDKGIDHPNPLDPDEPVEMNNLIGIQATDKDGDFDIDPIKVVIEDDGPRIWTTGQSITHDETKGIDTSTNDVTGTLATLPLDFRTAVTTAGLTDGDIIGNAHSNPVVTFDAGTDGLKNLSLTAPTGSVLNGEDSGLDTLANNNILLYTDGADDNIVWGKEQSTGTEIFAIYLDENDNSLWLSQFAPIKHDPNFGPNDIAQMTTQISVTITDNDGDKMPSSPILIRFLDDGIVLSVTNDTILIDETAGPDGGSDDTTSTTTAFDSLGLTAIETALKNLGPISVTGTDNAAVPPETDPPTDGLDSLTLTDTHGTAFGGLTDALSNTFLKALDDKFIFLKTDGDLILGVVDDGAGGERIIFALHFDSSTHDLWLQQYEAIKHTTSSDPDDVESINNLLYLHAVDKDGDSSSQNLTIEFRDDGPTITSGTAEELVHDETPGVDTDTGNEDDYAGSQPLTVQTLYGLASVIGVAKNPSTGMTWSGGTDGVKSVALTNDVGSPLGGAYTGLTRTSDSKGIYLFSDPIDATIVYGFAGTSAGNAGTHFAAFVANNTQTANLVFALYLEAGTTDGNLWLLQYQAIEHPTGGFLSPDEAVSIDPNKIYVTVIDEDGDTVVSSNALPVSFQDDAPTADDDRDTVDIAGITTGNVITGVDIEPPNELVADSPGVDTPPSISSITHANTTYTAGATVIDFPTALGGLFVINKTGPNVGHYTYTAPTDAPTISTGGGPSYVTVTGHQYSPPGTLGILGPLNSTSLGFGISSPGVSEPGTPRFKEINYIDNAGGISETLVFKLDPYIVATAAVADINFLFATGSDPSAEKGQWEVFLDGSSVDSAVFTATSNNTETININPIGPFDEIRFTAVDITPGFTGTQDNSDYYVHSLTFKQLQEVFEYTLEDADGDQDTAVLTIDVDFAVDHPDPSIDLNAQDLIIKEDNSGTVSITASTSADSHLTEIVITGFHADVTDEGPHNWFDFASINTTTLPTYDETTQTLTITGLPTGTPTAYLGSFDIIPPADSDVDAQELIAGLFATVTAADDAFPAVTGIDHDSLSVITDAVADEPTICGAEVVTNGLAYFIAGNQAGGNKTTLYRIDLDADPYGTQDVVPTAIDVVTVAGNDTRDFEALASYDGYLYGFTTPSDYLAKIDPTNGSVVDSATISSVVGESAGATFANGVLYLLGTSGGSTKIYTVDITTAPSFGTILSGPIETGLTLQGLAFNTLNQTFYTVSNTGSNTYVYELDVTDGSTVNVVEIPGNPDIQNLAYGENGKLWAFDRTDPGTVYALDPHGGWSVETAFIIDNSDVTGSGIENLTITDSALTEVEAGDRFGLNFGATFGDYQDASETHYFLVNIPDASWHVAGGTVVTDPTGVPAGTYVRIEADPLIDPGTGQASASVILETPDQTHADFTFNIYAVAAETTLAGEEDDYTDNFASTNCPIDIQVREPMPDAINDAAGVESPGDYNVVICFDVSSSMNEMVPLPGGGTATRLELAKDALSNFAEKYFDIGGDVEITLLIFAHRGSNQTTQPGVLNLGTFTDSTSLDNIIYIDDGHGHTGIQDATDYYELVNRTNYNNALNFALTVLNADLGDSSLDGYQHVFYFMTDGERNQGGPVTSTFRNFTYANGIDSYAIGMGSGVSATDPDLVDILHSSQQPPLIADDENDLAELLENTLPGFVTGNILTNDDFGPDGPGSIVSITDPNGTVYPYAPGEQTIPDGDNSLKFNFDTGDYTYIVPQADVNTPYQRVFTYTIEDSDGSQDTATLIIDIVDGQVITSAPFIGGTGNDALIGTAGDDVITGGDGQDFLHGSEGNDTLNGNAGDDIVRGDEGSDSIAGGLGVDSLYGGAGSDIIFGGAQGDLIKGGAGGDALIGEAGHDTIYGGAGVDTIIGGLGDDTITDTMQESGTHIVDGGPGIDTVKFARGTDGITLDLTSGNIDLSNVEYLDMTDLDVDDKLIVTQADVIALGSVNDANDPVKMGVTGTTSLYVDQVDIYVKGEGDSISESSSDHVSLETAGWGTAPEGLIDIGADRYHVWVNGTAVIAIHEDINVEAAD